MIEKLSSSETRLIAQKLNEVIAAVNGLTNTQSAFGYDQNIADATAYAASLLTPLSVPEADPQEQETRPAPFSPLEQALDDFEYVAQGEEVGMCSRRGWDKPEALVKARAAVIAAAHREYAQPAKGTECPFCDQERAVKRGWSLSPESWARYHESHKSHHSAAQPGKGV